MNNLVNGYRPKIKIVNDNEIKEIEYNIDFDELRDQLQAKREE